MASSRTAVKALGEVALRVNDLGRMKRFYADVIGFELLGDFDTAVFFKVAEGYGGHTQVLVLFDRSEVRPGSMTASASPEGVGQERSTLDHLAFSVDLEDLDSEQKRLESLGLEVFTAVHNWVKWRSIYVRDPEGNVVEMVSFDPNV